MVHINRLRFMFEHKFYFFYLIRLISPTIVIIC